MAVLNMDRKNLRAFSILAVYFALIATFAGWVVSSRVARADRVQRVLESKDCPNCDLDGVTMRSANLQEANLEDVTLRGANLGQANLREAALSRAILSEANLVKANLNGAVLS